MIITNVVHSSYNLPLKPSRGGLIFQGAVNLRQEIDGTNPTWTAMSAILPFALLTSHGTHLRNENFGYVLWNGLVFSRSQVDTYSIPPPVLAQPNFMKSAKGVFLKSGEGVLLLYPLPLPAPGVKISGTTKNSTGAAVGSCTVSLYRTTDGKLIDTVTSDPSLGTYTFNAVGLGESYFIVAYLPGSPDIAGTTVNTLTGS